MRCHYWTGESTRCTKDATDTVTRKDGGEVVEVPYCSRHAGLVMRKQALYGAMGRQPIERTAKETARDVQTFPSQRRND